MAQLLETTSAHFSYFFVHRIANFLAFANLILDFLDFLAAAVNPFSVAVA